MQNSLELSPLPLKIQENEQRRSCLIKESNIGVESINKELWFLYPADLPMPEDNDCDAYLLAALLPAMQSKADIIVRGSVSKELLTNLTELQYIWHKWSPEEFFIVDIKVDIVRSDEVMTKGAIVAFSGGADAQFTAYRHSKEAAGYATQDIKAGIFIQGLDIPLTDAQGFSGAAKLATVVLDDLDIDLKVARTNIRELWTINWEYYFAAAIAAVLSGFSRYAGRGLIGSSEPYDSLLAPWGSHPMTDPLLSSGTFKVIHDGAGFSRSEKIKFISGWDLGVKNLRVCWAGGDHDRNCGRCEKCVRTRLNFILSGVVNPKCFDSPLKTSNFKSIVLGSEGARNEWELIRSEIIQTERGLKWLPQIDQVLKRKPSLRFARVLPLGSKRRELTKKVLAKKVKEDHK